MSIVVFNRPSREACAVNGCATGGDASECTFHDGAYEEARLTVWLCDEHFNGSPVSVNEMRQWLAEQNARPLSEENRCKRCNALGFAVFAEPSGYQLCADHLKTLPRAGSWWSWRGLAPVQVGCVRDGYVQFTHDRQIRIDYWPGDWRPAPPTVAAVKFPVCECGACGGYGRTIGGAGLCGNCGGTGRAPKIGDQLWRDRYDRALAQLRAPKMLGRPKSAQRWTGGVDKGPTPAMGRRR